MSTGVTVYTSTGNTYTVKNGADWGADPTMTGELAVTVSGKPAGADQEKELASFGSVEAVYLTGEVTIVSGPATPPRGL